MQISIFMLIFLLFLDQISTGMGKGLGGAPHPLEESQVANKKIFLIEEKLPSEVISSCSGIFHYPGVHYMGL